MKRPIHRPARPLCLAAALVITAPAIRADIAVSVSVDPDQPRAAISPWIYGSNQDLPGVPLTTLRQGGNRMTGYNWENNASNAGADYFHNSDNFVTWYMGIPSADENTPGITATKFHEDTIARGAEYSLVTLQLAGYVAKDKSGTVTEAQAAPSSRWVPVSFTKPGAYSVTPDATDNAVYMDEFIHFLVDRLGPASSTGIRGYNLDNEPDLWSHTHARLHPSQPTCTELVARNIEAAQAVKRVDPSAETLGFVSYGFNGYVSFQDAPDWTAEKATGSYRWFVDYYLDKLKQASDTAGVRLLDVLDLHNYTEARGGGERVSDSTNWGNIDCNKARLQAPRSYWDPTYIEDSWVGQWLQDFLPLIPNVKASIDAFYPGTKFAITEYNFGGGGHISGGIAHADALGIFADEGVHLATWWKLQDDATFIEAAFRLFLDYDGAGSTYGDIAVTSAASDRATCSVHASIDSADPTRLHVILLNKSYDEPAAASIQIAGTRRYASARVYAFDPAGATITERTAVPTITDNQFTCTLPALTAAHLVLTAAAEPPTITLHPTSASVTAGAGTTLTVAATAAGEGTLTYQWQLDGVDIAGATSASYTLPSVQAFHAGAYTCVVSEGEASATSGAASLTVNAAPASNARLLNLSTRAFDSTGDNQLIPGFVISGTGTKRMLVRAVGPGMWDEFEMDGHLPDSQLSLVDQSTHATIASNDDWGTAENKADIISVSAEVGAFALLDGSRDAVILIDLPPGHYTAPAPGVGGATGIAMVELYDADDAPTANLINISNRGFVDVGDRIMIPGFVISNEGARTLLVRAVGPGLAAAFPADIPAETVLQDPVLTVFSGGNPILTNDDWSTAPGAATTASTAVQVGGFPLPEGSTDAAFVITLPPGAYTMQATGKNGSTGVALVEVYLVP